MTAASLQASPRFMFSSWSRTHVGSVRTVNEDRILERPETGLWAIADGMGGHHHGDRAAETVIQSLDQAHAGVSGYALLADVTAGLQRANAALRAVGDTAERSGATVVALLAREGHFACVWCGDSRAYLFRRGVLMPITRDHSVVQQMIDRGELLESARYAHPRANVVTSAIGVFDDPRVERRFTTIEDGDVILLCSDGLTACMDDAAICAIVAANEGGDAAAMLMEEALRRSPRDNVTLILVRAVAI